MTGPVDEYLDRLFDRLAGTGAAGRRTLAEVEDHLCSAADDGEALGLNRHEAELRAVGTFGPVESIAAQVRAVHRPDAWLRPALAAGWLAGAIGLLAVGASGLVAEAFGRIFGATFVAGDMPGVTYTAARCAQYLALDPGAGGCAQAAAVDHWGEVVMSRVAAGVLGLLMLLVIGAARRSAGAGPVAWWPPRGAVTLPMTVLFGLAGAALTGLALLQVSSGGTGMVGANLSDGLVALAAAAVCALAYRWRRQAPGATA